YKTKDGDFKSLGEFLSRVRKTCDGEAIDGRLKTAGHMEEADDSQGGFLVPEQWADKIFHAALEGAIVRPRVGKAAFRIKGDSLKVRKLNDDDRSSSIFGGITFLWKRERGDKAVAISKPAIGERELTLHKLVGSCFVSNELEDDYGAFGAFMELAFGQAIRFIEDDVFINGTGVGQPLGVLNSTALITVARQQANQIVYEDVMNLIQQLLPGSWGNAVFLFNPDTLGEILALDVVENNVVNIVDVSDRKLCGFPFIVTEKCPALGTMGDILLADFSNGHYLIADKELEISGSRHVDDTYWGIDQEYHHHGFITDETFWRVVLRVDGQPLMDAPLTPLRGANTVSPFVALDVTSS
ncbi:unnamed protein product, partial [marine sediment metagenome]